MVDQETDQNHMDGTFVGQETDQKQIFKKDWTRNSREWTKKMSCLWDGTIFFWPTKKNEKWTRKLAGQETDKNYIIQTIIKAKFLAEKPSAWAKFEIAVSVDLWQAIHHYSITFFQ